MLVLARSVGERIVVRDAAGAYLGTITICDLKRGKARLGFEGFAGMPLNREEVGRVKQSACRERGEGENR